MNINSGVLDSNIDLGKLRGAGLSEAQISNILQSQQDSMTVRTEDKDPYVEIRGLPSGSRYYTNPMGMPIKLKGMPLKVCDAITLEAMDNSGDSELLDEIFRNRIKGVNPGDILVGDELYIKAWLREQTFIKNPLEQSFECERCGHLNVNKPILMDNFIVYSLPESIKDPMECTLPICNETIKIRFMRRRDRTRIDNHIATNDVLRRISKTDVKLYEIASVMVGMAITDAVEYLKMMDPVDFAVLNTFFIKMNFGFTGKVFMQCEKEECGYNSIIPIPFQDGYFLPKIGLDLSNEN